MKEYIKEHATEFAGADGVTADDDEEEVQAEKAEKAPTEAAAYAAQQRKERQDRDFWSMQGGLDSVVSGVKSVGSGFKAVFEALSDIMSDGPGGKQTLIGGIILLLVLSNVYTYYRSTGEGVDARRARRLSGYERGGVASNDVEEAVRRILQERSKSPVEQARELEKTLDGVEERVRHLRALLSGVPTGEKNTLNDLD
jgi:hypothetical protein